MVTIKPKTKIGMKLGAKSVSHTRTDVSVRDLTGIIDEPEVRGGTNLGLTPTETLMASLLGCTNVITNRIAEHMGVEIGSMDIALSVDFDRRGVMLQEDVERPFSNVVLDIDIATDATPEQMEQIKTDLQKFCPIAKVIRGSGVTITENWNVSSL
jgi:uncharacterized OsmC-like protein